MDEAWSARCKVRFQLPHLKHARLSLTFQSIIFASGDSGVANRYNAGYENSCLAANESYVDVNGTRFSPSFPTNW